MRTVTVALLLLLAGGFYFALALGRGGGWTASTPSSPVVAYDRDYRAIRQESFTVSNQDGATRTHSVTILGPVDRVLSPWVEVEADLEGLTLRKIDGELRRLPPEVGTVHWDPVAEDWVLDPFPFPPLAPPSFRDGGSLARWLTERVPDEGDAVVGRAFGRAFGRRVIEEGEAVEGGNR